MGKKQAVLIGGLVVGLLGYGVSRRVDGSDGKQPAAVAPSAAELGRLREQVRKLEGSVASSERLAREAQVTAQAAQAAQALARGSEPTVQGKSDERLPPEAPVEPPREPSPQELAEQMDARFFGEGVDPDWSREARPRAERFGVTLPEGSRVVSLECRSSMCRIELSHPNMEAFRGFLQQSVVLGAHEWNGGVMATLMGDPSHPGEVQAVAYLAREGVDLSPASLEAP